MCNQNLKTSKKYEISCTYIYLDTLFYCLLQYLYIDNELKLKKMKNLKIVKIKFKNFQIGEDSISTYKGVTISKMVSRKLKLSINHKAQRKPFLIYSPLEFDPNSSSSRFLT